MAISAQSSAVGANSSRERAPSWPPHQQPGPQQRSAPTGTGPRGTTTSWRCAIPRCCGCARRRAGGSRFRSAKRSNAFWWRRLAVSRSALGDPTMGARNGADAHAPRPDVCLPARTCCVRMCCVRSRHISAAARELRQVKQQSHLLLSTQRIHWGSSSPGGQVRDAHTRSAHVACGGSRTQGAQGDV